MKWKYRDEGEQKRMIKKNEGVTKGKVRIKRKDCRSKEKVDEKD